MNGKNPNLSAPNLELQVFTQRDRRSKVQMLGPWDLQYTQKAMHLKEQQQQRTKNKQTNKQTNKQSQTYKQTNTQKKLHMGSRLLRFGVW
mmetsp:Transcript_61433/g.129619  ORF Transcript_61433/g.129619 Transcript_61433/m.129619 type:complete len:90 (+) Transcript_61433:565-834(+)